MNFHILLKRCRSTFRSICTHIWEHNKIPELCLVNTFCLFWPEEDFSLVCSDQFCVTELSELNCCKILLGVIASINNSWGLNFYRMRETGKQKQKAPAPQKSTPRWNRKEQKSRQLEKPTQPKKQVSTGSYCLHSKTLEFMFFVW